MSDQRFQLYIREILTQIQEKNKELSDVNDSDEFSRGKSEAYSNILAILKSEAISYKINLDNLGLKF